MSEYQKPVKRFFARTMNLLVKFDGMEGYFIG